MSNQTGTDLVVTVRPTIMDGLVVDWFMSEFAAYDVGRAIISASRNGVRIDCWLHQIPDGLLDTAIAAVDACKRRDTTREVEQRFATHTRSWGSGQLTPIAGRLAWTPTRPGDTPQAIR